MKWCKWRFSERIVCILLLPLFFVGVKKVTAGPWLSLLQISYTCTKWSSIWSSHSVVIEFDLLRNPMKITVLICSASMLMTLAVWNLRSPVALLRDSLIAGAAIMGPRGGHDVEGGSLVMPPGLPVDIEKRERKPLMQRSEKSRCQQEIYFSSTERKFRLSAGPFWKLLILYVKFIETHWLR